MPLRNIPVRYVNNMSQTCRRNPARYLKLLDHAYNQVTHPPIVSAWSMDADPGNKPHQQNRGGLIPNRRTAIAGLRNSEAPGEESFEGSKGASDGALKMKIELCSLPDGA